MQNFFVQTWGLLNYVSDVYTEALAEEGLKGLSMIEVSVLSALYERDGQTATSLSSAVGRAAPSFTRTLDHLVERTLIERRSHPTDRRAITVFLTTKGEALREPVRKAFAAVQPVFAEEIFDHLPLPEGARVLKPMHRQPTGVGEGALEVQI